MKKVFLAGVCLLLLAALLAVPVAAAADDPELEQVIIESCREEKWVNLVAYKLTEEDLETLFYGLRDAGKLPWYIDYSYTYYVDDDGFIQSFKPDSLSTKTYDRVLYEKKVAEVLDAVIKDGMTDVQKALAVHDYLITHCVYDESLEKNTGYDLLVNGTTVCAGYAEAYMDLMNRLGIECVYVSSEEMEHAWNLIRIDGSWYHVDLTWDDPSPDTYGLVEHTYFLVTDEQMRTLGDTHYGWATDIVCSDTRFQDAFWRDVESAIWFADSTTCYLRREQDWAGHIYSYNTQTRKQTRLYAGKEQYIDIGHGEYTYSHLGLSYWNGRLYFTDLTTLWSMKSDGSDRRREYSYDAAANDKFIYGSFVENDTLYLSLSEHDFDGSQFTAQLQATNYHTHSYEVTAVAATCLEPGKDVHGCGCGLTVEIEKEAATGHSFAGIEAVAPQGTEAGQCSIRCGDCEHVITLDLPACVFPTWLLEKCGSLLG